MAPQEGTSASKGKLWGPVHSAGACLLSELAAPYAPGCADYSPLPSNTTVRNPPLHSLREHELLPLDSHLVFVLFHLIPFLCSAGISLPQAKCALTKSIASE